MNLYLILLLSVLSLCLSVPAVGGQDQLVEEPVVVRHIQPLGGWAKVNIDQKDVQDATEKAVEKFNTKSKAKKYFKLVNVTSAKMKTTNILNYRINAVLAKTKCPKSETATDLNFCDMAQKRLKCKFEVELDPRNNQYEVKIVSCNK
ncbi:cystatin [Clarias gariepinus]